MHRCFQLAFWISILSSGASVALAFAPISSPIIASGSAPRHHPPAGTGRRSKNSNDSIPPLHAVAAPPSLMRPSLPTLPIFLLAVNRLGIRLLARGKSTQRKTAGSGTSSTALNVASLEEASLYRPSFPPYLNTKNDGTTTFVSPALFTPTDCRPIVLFDGACNLCNWGVQLLLDYDSCSQDERGNLRVAALQSRVGQLLLDRLDDKTRDEVLRSNSGDSDDGGEQYKSIVVCGQAKTWINTAAVLKMGRSMKFPFRPIALLAWLIPSFIRNVLYKGLSRNRKKLFGERSGECRLWDDNFDKRFVDDSLLGGVGSSTNDPFADPNAPAKAPTEDESALDVGDIVRIESEEPVVVKHLASFPDGLCVSGCTGRVVRNEKPYVVQFDLAEMFALEEESVEGEAGTFRAYLTRGQLHKL